ncbi:MAG: NYN domain-containing protein [Chloroflexota bacterium]|nr:NYN domain-containing protein [Chloroflexota bacterium]MDE2884857.1 NYN domain-containing protein [Chloroflexota bacterium]
MDADTYVFVDGNNVMGSRPDGWWRDRASASRRLVADLQPLARRSGVWTVVFDGSAPDEASLRPGALRTEYAAHGGADAADDRIVELLRGLAAGVDALVYTSDRRLRDRATALGARVEGASVLLRGVEEAEVNETASWAEFEAASPELARLGLGLFDETGLVMLGTIRRDGSPRISPVEFFIFAGELYLGMIWQSRKAQDLRRDPRCMVMSTVHDRMLKDGEFKMAGIATEVTDEVERHAWSAALLEHMGFSPEEDDEPYHLFKIGVLTASFAKIENDDWSRLFWRAGEGTIPHRAPERPSP